MILKRSSVSLKHSRRVARLFFIPFLFTVSLLSSVILFAASADYPVFVAQVPNPNDYVLFANGGWDGNWYVGYNNGWIKKLPAIPKGNYAHARTFSAPNSDG